MPQSTIATTKKNNNKMIKDGSKSDVWTPKQIAKWIKSKGRGKAHNYCVLCKRQFRDGTNGLKAHCMTEAHLSKVRDFADNPEKFINANSDEFKRTFVECLQHFRNQRVSINVVFKEFRKPVHHIHLGATRWPTLTDFAKEIGQEGVCHVDEDENGHLFLLYSKTDENANQNLYPTRETVQLDEEQREALMLQRQIDAAKKADEIMFQYSQQQTAATAPVEDTGPITIQFALPPTQQEQNSDNTTTNALHEPLFKKRKLESNSIEENDEPAAKKPKLADHDKYWICKNIVVQLMNKQLEKGAYYKKKGVITSVDGPVATIELLDSRDILQMGESDLQTVIPKVDGKVRILKGAHKGQVAILKGINTKSFSATLECIASKTVVELPYEDFSKLQE